MTAKLEAFLMILARDHLPTGTIERILRDHVALVKNSIHCDSPELLALATRWAEAIREGEEETAGKKKEGNPEGDEGPDEKKRLEQEIYDELEETLYNPDGSRRFAWWYLDYLERKFSTKEKILEAIAREADHLDEVYNREHPSK